MENPETTKPVNKKVDEGGYPRTNTTSTVLLRQ